VSGFDDEMAARPDIVAKRLGVISPEQERAIMAGHFGQDVTGEM